MRASLPSLKGPQPTPAFWALLWASFCAVLCLACSQADEPGLGGPSSQAPQRNSQRNSEGNFERNFERNEEPEVRELRLAIEAGRPRLATQMLAQLGARLGVEAELLRARILAQEGRGVAAGRVIEEVRERAPKDPRVYATAAELHALAGRLETAQKEIGAGLEACGMTPELERAKGVLFISMPRAAARGLTHLQKAVSADPDLPFSKRPLNQAHLLVAKAAMAAGDAQAALREGRAALTQDPTDVDTRRFLVDVLVALGRFDVAIEILEELIAEGQPLESELALTCKRAGMMDLLAGERESMLAYFERARDLGLSEEELGTGARLLREAAAAQVEAAIEALRAEDFAAAEERLIRALELDPDSIEAQSRLGVALFKQHKFEAAAERWRAVMSTARDERLSLPEPVHIYFSQALFRSGDLEGARLALEDYLDREPFGDFTDRTRAQLELLDD